MPSVTVSMRIAALVHALGMARGVDADQVLREAGLNPASRNQPDARITLDVENKLWTDMARACDDPAFGLNAALDLPRGAFGVLEYVIRSSATWEEAARNLIRYNALVHDVAVFSLQTEGQRVRLSHRFVGRLHGASLHAADFTMVSLVQLTASLLGSQWTPLEVTLQHAAPPQVERYRKVFGVRPIFDAEVNSVVYRGSILGCAIVEADPELQLVIRQHAEALLAALPKGDGDFMQGVRDAIWAALNQGDSSIEAVASRLHLTPRTLQRRLRDEGTSHRALCESMRREFAQQVLAERTGSVAEVAYLLGYSEPSAFHRAFKRWTGKSPAAWRAEKST